VHSEFGPVVYEREYSNDLVLLRQKRGERIEAHTNGVWCKTFTVVNLEMEVEGI